MVLRHFSWYPAGGDDSPELSLFRSPGRGRVRQDLVVPIPGNAASRTTWVSPAFHHGLGANHRTLRLNLNLNTSRGETDSKLDTLAHWLRASFVPAGAPISFSIVRPINFNWYLGTHKRPTLGCLNFRAFHFLVTSKPLEFRKRISRQCSTFYPPDRSLLENISLFIPSNTQLIWWICSRNSNSISNKWLLLLMLLVSCYL